MVTGTIVPSTEISSETFFILKLFEAVLLAFFQKSDECYCLYETNLLYSSSVFNNATANLTKYILHFPLTAHGVIIIDTFCKTVLDFLNEHILDWLYPEKPA